MPIKHLFFDLDHTLWDFEKNSALTFQQIFKTHEIPVSLAVFLPVYVPINFRYWKQYREEKVSKEALRYGRLKETFDALNIYVSDTIIDQLAIDYITFLPHYNHLFEGTIDLLEYASKKYELHIITNGFEEVQDLKLEKAGIKKYFNQIITSESVGVKKPNPIIFAHALKEAQANVTESMMIGDSYEADILGALKYGMQAIHCNFIGDPPFEDCVSIRKLAELKNYF